jgi:hypothetical protein
MRRKELMYEARTIGEFELLSAHFGPVQFDPDDLTWVLVERFNLPSNFNRDYTELIIELNKKYPLLPPQDFYLRKGLLRKGDELRHYYETGFESKRFRKEGYAWYCLHIKSWKPDPYSMVKGDNLLTAAEAVYKALRSGW